MATRRKKVEEPEMSEAVVVENKPEVKQQSKMGMWGWLGILIAVMCVYWWKTESWPVVAIVANKPIWRAEVNKELYRQGGKMVVDGLVTESLVKDELKKRGVMVSAEEINAKVEEVKKSFASEAEFEAALSSRGMTLTGLKGQMEIQAGIEKLLSERVSVTASETAGFVKQAGAALTASTAAEKTREAEKILKEQKLQQEINSWVEQVRTQGKVWWFGKV